MRYYNKAIQATLRQSLAQTESSKLTDDYETVVMGILHRAISLQRKGAKLSNSIDSRRILSWALMLFVARQTIALVMLALSQSPPEEFSGLEPLPAMEHLTTTHSVLLPLFEEAKVQTAGL